MDCLVPAKRMSSFFYFSNSVHDKFNNVDVPVRTAIELPVFTQAQLVLIVKHSGIF